jgi:hypothetical protein
MEPECSLPCSQEPGTGFYPELEESCPHEPISFSTMIFNIIISSGFRPETLYALLFILCGEDNKSKEDEMDEACSMHGNEIWMHGFGGIPQEIGSREAYKH